MNKVSVENRLLSYFYFGHQVGFVREYYFRAEKEMNSEIVSGNLGGRKLALVS